VVKEWHVVLNTYFVDTVQIEIKKQDLDTLPKDNGYADDLTMTFTFGVPRGAAPTYEKDEFIERMVEVCPCFIRGTAESKHFLPLGMESATR